MNNFINLNNVLQKLIIKGLRSSGYSTYSAERVYRRWYEDIFNYKKTTIFQKLWAQQRGFFSEAISDYCLTEKNYRNYLSDFDYFRMYPINGPYSKWIDDKLIIKYILRPFAGYLPEYYFQICNGEILQLSDCPDGFKQDILGIINLLKAKQCLAAKLTTGTLGKGFYKLAFENDKFLINNQLSNENEINELIVKWQTTLDEEFIITEYIQAHSELRKIWNEAPGALRIVVIRERNQSPRMIYAYKIFATKKTGTYDKCGGGRRLLFGRYSDR